MNAGPSLAGRVDAVVIGASTGGVEALSILLPALPAGLRAPCFIVLHLPRERPSLLVEIYAPKCAVPVREACDKEPVAAGTLYFAPPDYHLLLDTDPQQRDSASRSEPHLALSAGPPVNFSRPAINVLFESAVDIYGVRLLGILLTGASQDGAAGIAAVHRAGGVTVVQHPQTAQSPLMVEAALKRTAVDHVLDLAQIAVLLRTLDAKAPSRVH